MLRFGLLGSISAAILVPLDAHGQTLTKESFIETIRAARPAIQECYESRRATNPTLKGFVVVSLTVDKDGSVIEAAAERNGTGDESLGKCVAAQMEGLRFPAPGNAKPTKATFQFTFTPGRYFPIPPESLGPELPDAPSPPAAAPSEMFSLKSGADSGENDIAVMPLVGNRVPETTVAILNELLIAEVDELTDHNVIGTSDINAMLGLEKMKEAVGCDDVACAAEIGGALGVRFLLAGSVSTLGGEIIVNLKLIDIAAQSVKSRGRETTPGDEMFFRYAVRNALLDLLGKTKQPLPEKPGGSRLQPDGVPVGQYDRRIDIEWRTVSRFAADKNAELPERVRAIKKFIADFPDANPYRQQAQELERALTNARIEVRTGPVIAEVIVDGQSHGNSPYEAFLPPGKYEIASARDGYLPDSQTVSLVADTSVKVDLMLRPISVNPFKLWGHISFWTGVGAGGLMIGIGHVGTTVTASNARGGDPSARDTNQQLSNLALSGYLLAGVGVAIGVVLWILSPGDESWAEENLAHIPSQASSSSGRRGW